MADSEIYLDIKVTCWKRIHFNPLVDNADKLLEVLKRNPDDIYDDDLGFREVEALFDTEEEITVEDNDFQSTKEFYVNGNLIWQNGKS
jgi:hypothetical protein